MQHIANSHVVGEQEYKYISEFFEHDVEKVLELAESNGAVLTEDFARSLVREVRKAYKIAPDESLFRSPAKWTIRELEKFRSPGRGH